MTEPTDRLTAAMDALMAYNIKGITSGTEIERLAGFVERAAGEVNNRFQALLQREQTVTQREAVAHDREVAVQLREDAVTRRLNAIDITERTMRKVGAPAGTWFSRKG